MTSLVSFAPALRSSAATSRFSLSAFLKLRRQRAELANLSDAMLDDIGVTREEALSEASRPSWDAPDHWRA